MLSLITFYGYESEVFSIKGYKNIQHATAQLSYGPPADDRTLLLDVVYTKKYGIKQR